MDVGKAFELIQYRDLEAASITETELHDIGIRNLEKFAASENLRIARYGNLFAVLLDGNFEASLLLVDDLWSGRFRQFVKGDYLVAIPNRDILAFCDRFSSEGRQDLAKIIDRIKDTHEYRLSQQLHVRLDGRWIPEDGA